MESVKKSIQINAPKQKVWDVLTNNLTEWGAAFAENVGGDLSLGGKSWFIGKDGTGMKATVTDRTDNESLKLVNDVIVMNNVESTEMGEWAGTGDTYMLAEDNGVTTLTVESTAPTQEDLKMIGDLWDGALAKIKELAEK